MALRINTNIAALNATRTLNNTTNRLTKSLARLSSGLRINSAADGSSALVVSEKQKAQIAGIDQAMQNVDRAVSLVQTAEGAFAEINALLISIRNKALDSKNTGVYGTEELQKNQDLLLHIQNFDHCRTLRRLSLEVKTRDVQDSFILGSPTNGILGTNKLGYQVYPGALWDGALVKWDDTDYKWDTDANGFVKQYKKIYACP